MGTTEALFCSAEINSITNKNIKRKILKNTSTKKYF